MFETHFHTIFSKSVHNPAVYAYKRAFDSQMISSSSFLNLEYLLIPYFISNDFLLSIELVLLFKIFYNITLHHAYPLFLSDFHSFLPFYNEFNKHITEKQNSHCYTYYSSNFSKFSSENQFSILLFHYPKQKPESLSLFLQNSIPVVVPLLSSFLL
jgi:hypothetical protein